MQTFAKEERMDPEDKGIETNSFKERPDIPAGHRMISYPIVDRRFILILMN
ncbi:MAG: hypothetical protein WA461_04245 [Nitrososphaeraceae archaeon]